MEALLEQLGPLLAKLPAEWAVIVLLGLMMFKNREAKQRAHDPMAGYSAALSEFQARLRDVEDTHTDHESRISFLEGQSSTRNPRR